MCHPTDHVYFLIIDVVPRCTPSPLAMPKNIMEFYLLVSDLLPISMHFTFCKKINTIISHKLVNLSNLLMLCIAGCKQTKTGKVLIHQTNNIIRLVTINPTSYPGHFHHQILAPHGLLCNGNGARNLKSICMTTDGGKMEKQIGVVTLSMHNEIL
jgi:hypothetical protein